MEKINILLVDDRPENLLALEAIIEKDNYNLIKAYSGEEALKYLLKYEFAVILLDVQMPGIDGIETAKIIKAREKTKNIPLLFITANNMDSDHIFKGYSVGAIDYILKPVDPIILKAKVDGFVEIYEIKKQLIKQTELLSKKNSEIEYVALHDYLTGLPNRRMLQDELATLVAEAKKMNQDLGVIVLDIDYFKYVNDSLDFNTGDRVLQELAKRLTRTVRDCDFIARFGGDEFSIILPNTDREETLELAINIHHAFNEPLYIDHYELFFTASIGLSIFPYDGEDPATLIKNAGTAMFRAKEQGKNNYKLYHSGMNLQSYRTFIMQNDLRKAIERNELSLVYQPRMELETGNIKSAEALLRWDHPRWGKILPGEFISLAEESGQIIELGEWVLLTVCKQIRTWIDMGLTPKRIAINFSAQHFLQKDLVEKMNRILIEYDVKPDLIEIEITESVILGNETVVSKTLHQLNDTGVKVSIDDFGTGYSSLSYLRRFPIHALKIDKTFIDEITGESPEETILTEAIITLAHNLNMTVIAEGVESEQQMAALRKFKCEEIQGYFISPPLVTDKFQEFLSGNNEAACKIEGNNSIQKDVPTFDDLGELAAIQNPKIFDGAINMTKETFSITAREMDVFELLLSGLTNKEISEKLFISEHTVKNHITRIFQKLNVTDRVQAIALVYKTCFEIGEPQFRK
ncbi:EAL domain-containing protein [Bacillus timonensis]|uniref:EAL domain-containing protein n=1 Tax=Bacillus timonensis TaxID=1033734 RepID=UPI0013866EB9|nr:EAL domain-containing protein [Bacillus timonensis]